jgi:NRPS condensation-like uncharacterized protein
MIPQISLAECPDCARAFPMRLSDFEYYMFVDDRPSHPMVFVMVVHVDGCLQRQAIESSLRDALQAHPLFSCHILKIPKLGWCWSHSGQVPLPVNWQCVDTPVQLNDPVPIRAIDLQVQTGIYIEICHHPESSRIVFYLHHACCDGIGGLQFVSEVLARYGRKTAGSEEKQPQFEPPRLELLKLRDNFDSGKSAGERQQRSLKRLIGKIGRLFGRRPALLRPVSPVPAATAPTATGATAETGRLNDPGAARAIQSRVLSRSVNRGLRAAAAGGSVSVNDLCIREMLLHIRAWNRLSGPIKGDPWLRISVPVSMRTTDHQNMPACNMVGYSFITRRDSECTDELSLLTSIHQQTEDVLFSRAGIVALRFLGLLRKIPGAMQLSLSLKSCFCTVVLANVGDVRKRFSGRFPLQNGRWVAGDVLVKHIRGVAPVRPNTRAAVTIGEYAGTLSIHLRTDSTVIGPEDSERFLNEFTDRLLKLAAVSREQSDRELESDECPTASEPQSL